ncbi:MAG TPA: hypothetical protein VN884_04680 [Candidatus Sulfotelmatobacter sp.]|nr:hypothetical protein [Candidatus Sulfotelmatobacter sp.]
MTPSKFFAQPTTSRSALRFLVPTCVWITLVICAISGAERASGDTERIRWKTVAVAQVKLDDKTPLVFNVYQPEKKKDSHYVLVLLGRRYIELDIKAKLAYYVLLTDLQKNGNDLESDNFAVPTRLVSTSDWTVRDVGPAEQIKLTLGDYGRLLQVDLPHPPDMRAFY